MKEYYAYNKVTGETRTIFATSTTKAHARFSTDWKIWLTIETAERMIRQLEAKRLLKALTK